VTYDARVSRRGLFRRTVALAGFSVVASFALPVGAYAAEGDAPATVGPDPVQDMEGFGASGAWWPIDMVDLHPAARAELSRMLFAPGPVGIGLSAYRYNIGGGGVGVPDPGRAPETFLVAPGRYDWSRDVAGRTFLRDAAAYGVPVLVGFANSAPTVWTTNGQNQGGDLAPGAEAAFAGYLADVAVHLREAEGVTLTHLSPMNEPDYTFGGSTQEGMQVPVAQRAPLVTALSGELARRAPEVRVSADESSKVHDQLLPEAPQWLDALAPDARPASLAHHLYDFPDATTLQAARALGERFGSPLWATEVCCMSSQTGTWGQGYDPSIANAVVMAELIWRGLTHANDAAFHWWVAASKAIGADPSQDPGAAQRPNPDGWNDGLVYFDPNHATNGNQTLYPTKRLYALGNFSRYVRPGARRHDVAGVPEPLRVAAFSTDLGWAVVAINAGPAGGAPAALSLQLPVAGTNFVVPVETVETSADRELTPVPPPRVRGGLLQASLPAQSITTFVLAAGG
jgi:O-glycosyl hydrolase